MNKIIYLASYPKSGNTWLRMFITNSIKDSNDEFVINEMQTDGIYSDRQIVDDGIGIKSSMLNFDMVDKLRPAVYQNITENSNKNLYIKVHDAFTYLSDKRPLINTKCAKVIYILRNPLDVAVSYANHYRKSIDETIADMNNENNALRNDATELSCQLRQKLLSWSGHVKSYADAKDIPVHFLRYEDMKNDSFNAFKAAINFIGLDTKDKDIIKAIEQTDFRKLKEQENKQGFEERPYQVESFFRRGEIGDWENHLSVQQVKTLIDYHRDTMRKYGYLNEKGQPIY